MNTVYLDKFPVGAVPPLGVQLEWLPCLECRARLTMHTYTAVSERCRDTGLYVGYIPGFPGAHSQGETLEEINGNLREVISMILDDGTPADEAEDGLLEFADGTEDAMPEPPPGRLGEEAFHHVQPGTRGRGEWKGQRGCLGNL